MKEDTQALVDNWNSSNPSGTPVEMRKDTGELVKTVTRSEAWLLGGHTAVVMVDGVSGGYLLNRMRVIKQ